MLKKAANNLTSYLEKSSEFFTIFSLFPALISICMIYSSAILYGVKVPPIILLLSFLTTFAVYNLNKVTDHTEDTINKPNKTTKKQLYFTISAILCYLSVLIISITEGTQVFLICLIPLITGFIYSVKISKSIRRLKEILYIKNITIAFSWAFPGALLPALTGTVAIEKIVMVFLYIFILLFINTVLFDIIDMPGDKAANIKTIPLQLGKQKTTRLLLIINSLLIPWLITCLISGTFIKYLPVTTFGILHSYGIIWYFTTKEKKRYHADILIDGAWIPIITLLLLTTH
jgi:4-hydroxybenzoate polyprenyltransferase